MRALIAWPSASPSMAAGTGRPVDSSKAVHCFERPRSPAGPGSTPTLRLPHSPIATTTAPKARDLLTRIGGAPVQATVTGAAPTGCVPVGAALGWCWS
ncbi:hypothetical protein [Actinoallomurus iriomotensis]|uniref:hypothetical protein n=1 Tax=Actinoallomurus iriomotensis TaxID=478107 RepID=UPI0025523995|nr:hypothetical protein [Actinoallomurus iriomotensis]